MACVIVCLASPIAWTWRCEMSGSMLSLNLQISASLRYIIHTHDIAGTRQVCGYVENALYMKVLNGERRSYDTSYCNVLRITMGFQETDASPQHRPRSPSGTILGARRPLAVPELRHTYGTLIAEAIRTYLIMHLGDEHLGQRERFWEASKHDNYRYYR